MSFRSPFAAVNGLAIPLGEHMGKVVLGVAPTAGFAAPALYTWLLAPALCSLHFTHLELAGKVLFQVMHLATIVLQS
jgi:hypothetical protein